MLWYIIVTIFFFFKQKTAYEMRISDWSSDVCSSDLSAVARVRRAGREVRAVDVGVGAAAAVAQRGGGVVQPGRGVRALGAVGAAVADEVGVAGRATAAERGGAFAQRDLAAAAAHRDGADGVGRGQVLGATSAVVLLDQVVAARSDAARQRRDLPGRARGRGVLHRPAFDADGVAAVVVQLDEVAFQGRAGVAPAAVHLADHYLRVRGANAAGQQQSQRQDRKSTRLNSSH